MTPAAPASPAKPLARHALRAGVALVLLAALLLGAALGYLKWHEDELIFVTALSHNRTLGTLPANAQRIDIPEAAGTTLAAILVQAPAAGASGYWVLHLHGNADTAFSPGQIRHLEQVAAQGFNVLGLDYRGYGLTPGVVSESHVYEDAEAAYQELKRRGVPDDHIILWGHSLGSGPAVYLATRHPAAALVLFGAFTSIPDMAAETYPLLPVRLLVGVQFDSIGRLPSVRVPLLIAHSVSDAVVPYAHALKNFAAAQDPKRLLTLKDPPNDGLGGHVNALYDHLDELVPPLNALLGAAAR